MPGTGAPFALPLHVTGHVSDQRNKSAPLPIMSSNLQNWVDIH